MILSRVNSFTDKTKVQRAIILPRIITYSDCANILNDYRNYQMIQVITNNKCKLPTNDIQDHLE